MAYAGRNYINYTPGINLAPNICYSTPGPIEAKQQIFLQLKYYKQVFVGFLNSSGQTDIIEKLVDGKHGFSYYSSVSDCFLYAVASWPFKSKY